MKHISFGRYSKMNYQLVYNYIHYYFIQNKFKFSEQIRYYAIQSYEATLYLLPNESSADI